MGYPIIINSQIHAQINNPDCKLLVPLQTLFEPINIIGMNQSEISLIELESGEFNSYDLNSFFAATIEEQDEQDGALLQSVDVYVGFKGAEALIETIQSSAFTAGPFGLPRTRIQVTLQQGINALGLGSSDYTGGDTMPIRLALNLTDGRVFSSQDAGGALQGSFFNSPYAYNTVIKCIPNAPQAGTYKVDMIDTYGDGWNGATLDFVIDGVTTSLSISGAQGASNSETVTVPSGTSSFDVIFKSGAWAVSYTHLTLPTKRIV